MKIVFASRCQQGLRDENQDRTGAEIDDDKACFVVCDGVAGLAGGDRAAQLVRDTLLAELHEQPRLTPENTHAAIERCREALREEQARSAHASRMSTTLAALFIDRTQQRAWWAHAGDSRVYHFRHGTLFDVTRRVRAERIIE